MLNNMGLRGCVAAIGTGRMRNHGGVELLAKFAPQPGNAALRIFRELLGGGTVLNGVYRLARLVFEVTQHTIELVFHFANFRLLLFAALGSEAGTLAFQFIFAGT